jgi:hypothetical protein
MLFLKTLGLDMVDIEKKIAKNKVDLIWVSMRREAWIGS